MPLFSLECRACGVDFEAVNHYARTCSLRCRQAAFRSRVRRARVAAAARFFGVEAV